MIRLLYKLKIKYKEGSMNKLIRGFFNVQLNYWKYLSRKKKITMNLPFAKSMISLWFQQALNKANSYSLLLNVRHMYQHNSKNPNETQTTNCWIIQILI